MTESSAPVRRGARPELQTAKLTVHRHSTTSTWATDCTAPGGSTSGCVSVCGNQPAAQRGRTPRREGCTQPTCCWQLGLPNATHVARQLAPPRVCSLSAAGSVRRSPEQHQRRGNGRCGCALLPRALQRLSQPRTCSMASHAQVMPRVCKSRDGCTDALAAECFPEGPNGCVTALRLLIAVRAIC